MFGVIVCPKCHRARGVELPSKSAMCVHCGRAIDVTKAKVYFKTASQEELGLAVKKMSESLAVDIDKYPAERKRKARIVDERSKVQKVKMNEEELRELALRMTREKGEFDLLDLMGALKLKDLDDATEIVETMLAAGIIYEPRSERFKALHI